MREGATKQLHHHDLIVCHVACGAACLTGSRASLEGVRGSVSFGRGGLACIDADTHVGAMPSKDLRVYHARALEKLSKVNLCRSSTTIVSPINLNYVPKNTNLRAPNHLTHTDRGQSVETRVPYTLWACECAAPYI